MKSRSLSLLVLVLLFLPQILSSQENILRLAPYSVSGQFLNNQIAQNTVTNGILANRVYVLQRGGSYLANAEGVVRKSSLKSDLLKIIHAKWRTKSNRCGFFRQAKFLSQLS